MEVRGMRGAVIRPCLTTPLKRRRRARILPRVKREARQGRASAKPWDQRGANASAGTRSCSARTVTAEVEAVKQTLAIRSHALTVVTKLSDTVVPLAQIPFDQYVIMVEMKSNGDNFDTEIESPEKPPASEIQGDRIVSAHVL